MNNIKVLNAGFFTTIQDAGRIGFQKYGMPVAGVMDTFSFRVANMLVGNNENEAVLEAAFLGPELLFEQEMIVALTGAEMTAKLNGADIQMWKSFKVSKGDRLALGGIIKGLRTYIAFGGEICVENVNNSKSTYVKSGIGGYKGRKLLNNDELKINVSPNAEAGKYLDRIYIPDFNVKNNIRAVLGPQDDYFTEEGINTFFNTGGYKITKEADRMGYRLSGNVIKHKDRADIISDAATFGAVQVPANGQPIILMADRQTTGGYTKIATVITPDLPILAQMCPGNEIVFKKVSLKEAHNIYAGYEQLLSQIQAQIYNSNKIFDSAQPVKQMKVTVNGTEYMVKVQSVN